MRRGAWVLFGALLVTIVLVNLAIWSMSRTMTYRWTTPPDDYCNVWDH